MTEFHIDAKGLGCAQPVILAKRALETHDEIIIDVDSCTHVENISALAGHTGYSMKIFERPGNIYSIKLIKVNTVPEEIWL